MKDIVASIVLYNEEREVLKRTIDSFLNTNLDIELILIDNSQSEEMSDFGDIEKVTYIHSGENVGFAAGQNTGLKWGQTKNTKYHLVLNPDIYFDNGVIETLFDFMEKNLDVGCVIPKVLSPDGAMQYLYRLLPTPFDLLVRRFMPKPISILFRKRIERYELKSRDPNEIQQVPYLSGCFMFLRGNVVEEVGFFDERFFLYLDDVDYSRRINRKFKNIFYPHVSIFHQHKRLSYKNFKSLRLHIISAIKYFNKWGWFFDDERKQVNRKALEAESISST